MAAKPTPHAGNRQTADAEWPEEENTNVGDPLDKLQARAKNAASSSKAAFASISGLRREVNAAVKQDQEDHKRIYTSMDDVKSKVDKLETKVDKLDDRLGDVVETVGDLREQAARTGTHVERLVSAMEAQEGVEVTIKTAKAKASIEDAADVRKLKRALLMKFLVPVITALAAAIAAIISTYLVVK